MERYQKEESPGDITAIAEKIKGWIDLRKKGDTERPDIPYGYSLFDHI